jgi:hypothetical protein
MGLNNKNDTMGHLIFSAPSIKKKKKKKWQDKTRAKQQSGVCQ